MIDGLRPYSEYKETVIRFLGEIPAHWRLKPLKHWVRINSATLQDNTPSDYCFDYFDIATVGTGYLKGKPQRLRFGDAPTRARRILQQGDTILSTVRTYLKGVYFIAENSRDLVASTGFAALTPRRGTLPKYVSYICQSDPFTDRVCAESVGTAYPAIAETRLGTFHIPIPPFEEQAAIVRFLDHVDRRIRRYIRAKRQLIALLNEQKQAIIHRAVTRGLDPNVRLKTSGVEWLGDVPEHWELSRIKSEFFCLNNRRIPLNGPERGQMKLRQYDYYGASGVIDKVDDYIFDDELLLVAEDGANLVLRNLPLAIIARGKFWVNNHAHILKPRSGNLEYLACLMETLSYLPWISGAAQPKLTKDRLMSIAIAVPPRAEQDAIIQHINQATGPIIATIERTKRETELVREYRTRLIADVVTGKLDVREAAAFLPDEQDEPDAEADLLLDGNKTAEEAALDT